MVGEEGENAGRFRMKKDGENGDKGRGREERGINYMLYRYILGLFIFLDVFHTYSNVREMYYFPYTVLLLPPNT